VLRSREGQVGDRKCQIDYDDGKSTAKTNESKEQKRRLHTCWISVRYLAILSLSAMMSVHVSVSRRSV
jgi:hypothetical protein